MDHKKIMYLLAGVFLVAGGWFWYAGRGDVSDIGKRADTVRNELESAREEQRDQAAALDRAENAAVRSAESIKDSQRTATEIKRLERSDAEVITDGQRILQEVRNGSRTQDKS